MKTLELDTAFANIMKALEDVESLSCRGRRWGLRHALGQLDSSLSAYLEAAQTLPTAMAHDAPQVLRRLHQQLLDAADEGSFEQLMSVTDDFREVLSLSYDCRSSDLESEGRLESAH